MLRGRPAFCASGSVGWGLIRTQGSALSLFRHGLLRRGVLLLPLVMETGGLRAEEGKEEGAC